MTIELIKLNANQYSVINEIIDEFGFETFKSSYNWHIDKIFSAGWRDYDDDFEEENATWKLVDNNQIDADVKILLSIESQNYIKNNIKNASLDITHFSTSNTYKLNIQYVFDVGTESECFVEFIIKMEKLGHVDEVMLRFNNEDNTSAQLTYLLMKYF